MQAPETPTAADLARTLRMFADGWVPPGWTLGAWLEINAAALADRLDSLQARAEAAERERTEFLRTFQGHVYVKNEDYRALVVRAEKAEARAAELEALAAPAALTAIAETKLVFDPGYATPKDMCAAMQKLARAALAPASPPE